MFRWFPFGKKAGPTSSKDRPQGHMSVRYDHSHLAAIQMQDDFILPLKVDLLSGQGPEVVLYLRPTNPRVPALARAEQLMLR